MLITALCLAYVEVNSFLDNMKQPAAVEKVQNGEENGGPLDGSLERDKQGILNPYW